ncbi:MAG: EsaB/YukD family protein [Clostridiales Family XIII bacterium]|jgi:hypothetical protein|nr:EsaB/YukD family protein [Clostridiales Family XIII bacterium]
MYISITIEAGGAPYDISIDDRQRIGEALAALAESGRCRGGRGISFFRSVMNETAVSSSFTFRECGILSGDLLQAIE